ncbi:MAG: N-acetyl-gamma-glutamyl-phosphate reductase [Bradymonadaceae bacterium]|nr:N-acetyl-gamma-glutamyl-phosphate reductase [Lujinxingiaceae bacterium]
MDNSPIKKRLGIVGARGHTGSELIWLLEGHPGFELIFVSSRELAGQRVSEHNTGYSGELNFEDLGPSEVAGYGADAYVLALPNDLSRPFVEAIERECPQAVIVDLSGDHRFDPNWKYGLPERFRDELRGARRIANPGCYATAMQLALLPIIDLLADAPHVFGVSGYSGAGTKPSPKNDLELLRDNLMPYGLSGHLHEREVSFQLATPVHFMPHVASFFRGITLTISTILEAPADYQTIVALYNERYKGEPLVCIEQDAPLVRDIASRHQVAIGGFTLDAAGARLVLVATIDNLLKGAATQALQNLNLASGFDELEGIRQWLD